MPILARRTAHQAPSTKHQAPSNLKFRTILLETLEQRSLFAADILNTSLHLDDSGPIAEPAQTEEPKQSLLRVKDALTAGNAVRFPDSNYFSALIAGVQEGAKVSGDEAVDAAWSDFHQRTANVPDASKASFGIIQSVADNPKLVSIETTSQRPWCPFYRQISVGLFDHFWSRGANNPVGNATV
jgi:hypothetical protein